ncbi:MAG: glycosyl hydrolase, partial [Cytophagaceae bacterium]|nr:glycosyl hydrolase [Cytophagaceae bacterium]
STQALNGHQFNVPRGLLKCADTDSFQIELPHVGLLPALPLTGNFPQLYQYLEDQRQVVKYVTSGDNYIGGKQIAKLALLTELADAAGHTLAKNKFLWLKNPLAGSNGRHLYYNAQWHTLTPYNGILGPQLLNDFHFSVGYILRGAATIAKFDPVWAQQGQWGGMVNFLIRGINNWDRSDTQFPFLRFHSPFLGHSHAGGTSARVGGAGQESSSEAINFAAAVFQWGLNTHQTEIRDLGVYLFLTEVETTKEYWYDVENTNFPPSFTAKHIWNVDGASHGKWTWFGTRPEHGLGINISLMNAHLLYLAHDTVYANELYEELKQDMRAYYANPAVSEEQAWQDVILAWRATFQADQVINRYESFGNFPYRFTYNGPVVSGVVWDDPGLDTHNDLPPAHFYHWIHALDSLGHVNSSVLANYSSYGVFDKEDCRHYVLYNPPGDPARMVQFTDGRTWFLPEDTTITYKWCFTALPSHLLNFTARPQGEQVRLDWSLASESGRGRFIIQRSDDGTLFYALDSLEENTLTGAGSQYYYIDAGARQGTVYYRIIYQETKGTMLYSEIRAVSNQESYQLYPNPTQSTCLLLSNKSGRSKYRLYQSNGIEVAQGSFEGSVELDMRYFASGMYIVWVYDEGGIPWVRKISKE